MIKNIDFWKTGQQYLVCLLFETLKGVMKNHQNKSEIKTPKIDPIFDVFPEASEISFK